MTRECMQDNVFAKSTLKPRDKGAWTKHCFELWAFRYKNCTEINKHQFVSHVPRFIIVNTEAISNMQFLAELLVNDALETCSWGCHWLAQKHMRNILILSIYTNSHPKHYLEFHNLLEDHWVTIFLHPPPNYFGCLFQTATISLLNSHPWPLPPPMYYIAHTHTSAFSNLSSVTSQYYSLGSVIQTACIWPLSSAIYPTQYQSLPHFPERPLQKCHTALHSSQNS